MTNEQPTYRPLAMPTRERDITAVCAYVWWAIGWGRENSKWSPAIHDAVLYLACDFVDNHQRPASEYGIGEGKDMDWDEHVETWFKSASDLIDP
jgi:hypothetical protein